MNLYKQVSDFSLPAQALLHFRHFISTVKKTPGNATWALPERLEAALFNFALSASIESKNILHRRVLPQQILKKNNSAVIFMTPKPFFISQVDWNDY